MSAKQNIPKFQVEVLKFSALKEIPGTRTKADFVGLLERMEFDFAGASDEELGELCMMALQDRKPIDAATLVLQHDLGDRLKEGQIRNMAGDMREEKLWEEYPVIALHEKLFNAASLLHSAFPTSFPDTDAARVRVQVNGTTPRVVASLHAALDESLVVRILADGMDARAALHRIFGEQIAGAPFPEASSIAWTVSTHVNDAGAELEIVGSGLWLSPLADTDSFTSNASADKIEKTTAANLQANLQTNLQANLQANLQGTDEKPA